MFSGIIESLGTIVSINKKQSNIHFEVQHNFNDEIYIDQSIAHNGCCLTVVEIDKEKNTFIVTAIDETLQKTNLTEWQVNTKVNLERCIKAGSRLDGHFVQGHVDTTSTCLNVEEKDGSWVYTFSLPKDYAHLVVDKGSIAINGTSLTLILPKNDYGFFQVAIIPYTYEHTNFHNLVSGSKVNIEFDIMGKYLARFREVMGK